MSELGQDVDQVHSKQKKGLWTIRLLFAAIICLVILMTLAFTDGDLGISHKTLMLVLRLGFFAFIALCITGLIFGFIEYKHNKKLALIGIIGNFLTLVLVIATIIAIVIGLSDFHPN